MYVHVLYGYRKFIAKILGTRLLKASIDTQGDGFFPPLFRVNISKSPRVSEIPLILKAYWRILREPAMAPAVERQGRGYMQTAAKALGDFRGGVRA